MLFTLEFWTGRMLLPAFGGSPGVWATALAFFAALLFVGYLYAHLLASRVQRSRAGPLHVAVALAALAAVTLAPQDIAAMRIAGLPEAVNVLLVLLAVAGAPAFLLTTTTPLLSAWYAGRGRDPWWLFAASNAASLAALLAYPLLIEPLIGLSTQHIALVAGIALFAVLLAGLALEGRRTRAAAAPPGHEIDGQAPPPTASGAVPLTWNRQALWLMAAFVPAGLLAATTTFLTTDLVAAPLLWVGPLGIYLASFVVAFSARGRRALRFVFVLVPGAATLLLIPYVAPLNWPVLGLLVVVLGSFAVLATALHGRLALDRPGAGQLTRFYLIVAAGGMLATAFVGLAAPVVFPDVYEFPLLIACGLTVLALMHSRGQPASAQPANAATHRRRGPYRERAAGATRSRLRSAVVALAARIIPYLAIAGLLLALAGGALPAGALVLLAAGVLFVAVSSTPWLTAGAISIALVAALAVSGPAAGQQQLFQGRSFFGVTEVRRAPGAVQLYSGTTLHGLQMTGRQRLNATTYYSPVGPLGDVFAELRQRVAGPASVGVVGLGAGTAATYIAPGDRMTFYEIDPLVIEIAHDMRYFTFLAEARGVVSVVPGDGRLSLATAPAGAYDLVVIDAFSSDVVPPHLLTREAFATYLSSVGPGGIVALHVSNRFYDLPLAVAATARDLGLEAMVRSHSPTEHEEQEYRATASTWAVIGQREDVARFESAGWQAIQPANAVLTDDFPDLMRVLRALP
ncbi:MAG TPA: fused MFS/spermidine synthase [Candidatus Limnocylindrales bacterium]|nr:fused MFS/spermidine synthase [Candidatus Limnocylindrales bacterium]